MAKKSEADRISSELSDALGLAVDIDCFLDGKARKAFPITLSEYGEFARLIGFISVENIFGTFMTDEGKALKEMIALVFKDQDTDEIMEQVNASNYEEFIKQVYAVQGITLERPQEDPDKKK